MKIKEKERLETQRHLELEDMKIKLANAEQIIRTDAKGANRMPIIRIKENPSLRDQNNCLGKPKWY